MPVCAQVCEGPRRERPVGPACCQAMLCVPSVAGRAHMANEPVWRWIRALIISDRKALRCV